MHGTADSRPVRRRSGAFGYPPLPTAIRQEFDREDCEGRRGQALWGMGLGLLCYLGLLGIDWFVVPDVLALDVALRITVGLPVGLVAIWILTRPGLPGIVYEAAPAVYGLTCALTIAVAMSRSEEPAALAYFCAGLVVMCFTINLVGMNPPVAATTCLTISVAMAAFSAASRFGTTGVLVTNLVFGVMVSGVATFANWSLLNQRRQAFLLRKRDERRLAQIARQRDILVRLATVDPLTDLPNRRGFETLVAADLAAAPAGTPVAAMMVDIDCFKAFNDGYGHPSGDAALRTVAQALSEACGARAQVGRFGGEEFGIVLFGRDGDALPELGRRLCRAVEARAVPHAWSDVASVVTVSAGIAAGTANGSQRHCADLLSRADEALYEAKRAGRNRVAVATVTDEPRGETPIAA